MAETSASAVALEDTTCVSIDRAAFFSLLDQDPAFARALLLGLTHRLVELTNRLAELSGSKVEPRFARLFLKLAGEVGRPGDGGTFIAMPLSRQELADLTGTTIETAIRIMSRWGKQRIVLTGFEEIAAHAIHRGVAFLPRIHRERDLRVAKRQ